MGLAGGVDEAPRISSFTEFYPVYLRMHTHATCRRLHVAGTVLAFVCLILSAALREPRLAIASPLVTNAFAWVGHVAFQKNRPGVFRYPMYGALGNCIMTVDVLRGRLRW